MARFSADAEVAGEVGILPGAVLVEGGLALAEFCGGLVAGGGAQLAGFGGSVVDVQIPDVLEGVQVGAGDGGGLFGDAVIPNS